MSASEDKPAALTIDEILILAGGYGRYQWQQAVLNCGCLATCASTLLLPNLLYPRLHDAWPTLTSADTAAATSLFFVGNFVGLAAWGAFGDAAGRRPATLFSLAMLIVAACLGFLCNGIVGFTAVRAAVGVAVGGLYNGCFLLQMEASAPADRMRSKIILATLGWVVGALWVDLIAYLVSDSSSWRLLALYLTPTAPLLVAAWMYLNESPRYLLAAGRPAEALAALHVIARTNCRPLPPNIRLQHTDAPPPAPSAAGTAAEEGPAYPSSSESSTVGELSSLSSSRAPAPPSSTAATPPASRGRELIIRVRELLHPSLRRRTLLVGIAWFGSTAAYYGVALNAMGTLGALPLPHCRRAAAIHSPPVTQHACNWTRCHAPNAHPRHAPTAGSPRRTRELLAHLNKYTLRGATPSRTCARAGIGGGSIYVQNCVSSLLEVPAYLLMASADRIGRRRAWAAFLLVTTASLLLLAWLHPPTPPSPSSAPLPNATADAHVGGALPPALPPSPSPPTPTTLLVALSLLARFGATGASAIVYVAAAEQWPTSCRNLGVNYGAACGRIGSVLAPLVTLLPSPGAVLGVVGALAAVAVMALPETGGEAIPETIGDAAAQQVELVAGAAPGAGTQLSVDLDVDRAQGGREGDGGVTTCERPNERLLGGQEMSDATR